MTGSAAVRRDDAASGSSTVAPNPPGETAPPDFAAIYEDHFDLVWRTLRRYGVHAASLDDAVQDVFLVVHTRLATFEGRSSLRTWIFGITRRVARDHRPSPQREPVGAETLEALPDLESKSPHAALEEIEAGRLLERLLAGLAPEKREAFILVELEQMTILEASHSLDVNSNTVHSRVRAARVELEQGLARLNANTAWKQRCAI